MKFSAMLAIVLKGTAVFESQMFAQLGSCQKHCRRHSLLTDLDGTPVKRSERQLEQACIKATTEKPRLPPFFSAIFRHFESA